MIGLCDHCRSINVATFPSARHNGTMFAHVFVLPTTASSPRATHWVNFECVSLTKYELPHASTFQLIGDSASTVQWIASYVVLISSYLNLFGFADLSYFLISLLSNVSI